MKKFWLMVLGIMLIGGLVFAESSNGGSAVVTDTSQNISLGKRHLLLINDGVDEVFVILNASPASSTDFELKSGESRVYDSDDHIVSVSLIASPAETANIRFDSWV